MRSIPNKFRAVHRRQFRIALSGPCGVGKSTLASLLAARYRGMAVIREPQAPRDIEVSGAPSPESVERFQRLMSSWRLGQVTLNAGSRILLFDRTHEEDRDVFLQLYRRLGCIDEAQLKRLARFSKKAEASIGSPDGIVVLTAAPEILRQRLEQAQQQRPHWLVKHIGLQHELYNEWIAKKRDRALVLDTARIDAHSICTMATRYIEGILVESRPGSEGF